VAHGQGEYIFEAVNALRSLAKVDVDIAEHAMMVASYICNGDRIYKELLEGIFEIERISRVQRKKSFFGDYEIEKLIKIGPLMIRREINQKKAVGNRHGSRKLAAAAILELANKGRRGQKVSLNIV
jgi:hypothetical protein